MPRTSSALGRGTKVALRDAQIKRLKEKIGELVLDIDMLKEEVRDLPLSSRLLGALRITLCDALH